MDWKQIHQKLTKFWEKVYHIKIKVRLSKPAKLQSLTYTNRTQGCKAVRLLGRALAQNSVIARTINRCPRGRGWDGSSRTRALGCGPYEGPVLPPHFQWTRKHQRVPYALFQMPGLPPSFSHMVLLMHLEKIIHLRSYHRVQGAASQSKLP